MNDKMVSICGHGSGTPSVKNMCYYCENRYSQKAANGKHKGVIEVRRHKLMTSDHRKKFVKKYGTILGRNRYSQDRRQYVYSKCSDGKYYSDCSSSGMATMEQIGLETGGLLNTAGIHSSGRFMDVPVTIKNGHIVDPWKLEVGDCLLFVGSDPSRPKQIGHVEYVYSVPGVNCKCKKKGSLRKKPDKTGKKLGDIYTGDEIRVIDDNGKGWSQVVVNGKLGYCMNSIFNRVGKSGFPKATVKDDCNTRRKNKLASKKVEHIKAGTAVKVITKHSHWTYIKNLASGVTSWVGTKHLKL